MHYDIHWTFIVQYDLYDSLLGLGNRGPCLSHYTASPSHKEREGWSDGRATIIEEGDKIVVQSFVKATGYYETVTLTRQK